MLTLLTIAGWVGTVLYLLNHAYVSLVKAWKPAWYFSGNLLAALLLVIQSSYLQSWQAVAVNGFWLVISAYSLTGKKLTANLLKPAHLPFILFFTVGVALAFLGLSFEGVVQSLAWSATLAFGLRYFLFASSTLSQRQYLIYNFYAASVIAPAMYFDANYPVLALEVSWAVISLVVSF